MIVIMTYDRLNPYFSLVKERYLLTKPGSQKYTQHIVLDLAGSGITYQVGDSVGIIPVNNQEIVDKTLQVMKASGEEDITDKRGGKIWKLKEFLTQKANLSLVSKKFYNDVVQNKIEGSALKKYLGEREVWDFLQEHHVNLPPNEICQYMMPLLPRLYSIASSQQISKDEIHLTVALVNYITNEQQRKGVCTHYLCNMAEENVPIYIQQHNGFTLPEDPDAPIIMIGPGTGIAPYRAFMQERIASGANGKNWLFFGECNRKFDFFYEDYWLELQNAEKLSLDLAFSRDQEQKVYVQHRMLEKSQELYDWLENGAYLYVCGDAERMAKDVESTLHQIIESQGHDPKAYVKQLRQEKRYLKDVY